MNIGSAILPTGSLSSVGGRAALAGLKGPSARDNLQLNTQDISSEAAQKSKTDKKSTFHITNTTDDTVESQENATQSTMKDKCRQDVQTRPTQKQDTSLETQLPATASVIAYLALAGTSDLKTNVEELTNVSAATAQGLLPTDKANLLNNTAIGNPPVAEQDGPPAVQNNKETADGSKPAGQDIESQKAKLQKQATEALAWQEAAGAKDTTVKQTENQITQITSSGNEPKTTTIANLPAASETAYANQSGNGPSNEGQAEKTAGKNNQSKNKLQQVNPLHNQQTDAQKSSNNILNKTQTLQSDRLQIQTNDKGSNGKEQIPLSNNQQVQNNQKISIAEQTSKNSQNFKLPSDLSGQIQESAKALLQSNKGEITVRLNPPELGSICLKVSDKGDQISGLLQVTRPETQHELQQFLPEILRNLEDAGISIKRFEVVLNNPSDQQTLQQYLYQQNNQQSYNPGTETQAGYQSFNYLFNDAGRYQQVGAVQTVGTGAGSLNI
jgi:flagellar hook-length control protein FliK